VNNTSKALMAYIQSSGVTDAREISDVTGIAIRTVYRCLDEIKTSAILGNSATSGNSATGGNSAKISASHGNSATGGTAKKGKGSPPKGGKPSPLSAFDQEKFEEFYQTYPRRVGRGQAESAWAKAIKIATPEEIMDGLRRLLPSMAKTEKQFLKHPSTWLNAKGWMDEVEVLTDPRRRESLLDFDDGYRVYTAERTRPLITHDSH
jgi:hypothetical protein